VAGSIGDVPDVRIFRERSGFCDVRPAVRHGRVVVVLPRTLAHRRSDIGDAETGVPLLALEREVVLEAVWSLEVRILSGWKADIARSSRSGGGEHTRKNDLRIVDRVGVGRLVENERHISKAKAVNKRDYVIEHAPAGPEDRIV